MVIHPVPIPSQCDPDAAQRRAHPSHTNAAAGGTRGGPLPRGGYQQEEGRLPKKGWLRRLAARTVAAVRVVGGGLLTVAVMAAVVIIIGVVSEWVYIE